MRQTAKVADDPHLDVVDYDAVLVGASIHAGKHQSPVTEFASEARDQFSERPTGFFQMSLSSATATRIGDQSGDPTAGTGRDRSGITAEPGLRRVGRVSEG